ncbi:hypothetical protein GA0115260_102632 [Streptomyces sp. MnatMP-M27]|nr:hypothetical protein GA0115260_102632 [Streptomyces sp. MnatMP-M27]
MTSTNLIPICPISKWDHEAPADRRFTRTVAGRAAWQDNGPIAAKYSYGALTGSAARGGIRLVAETTGPMSEGRRRE